MQTFLPHSSFHDSARVLDYRRLGKQRVEAMQLINILEGRSSGWANHPACKMWVGYTNALKHYCNFMISEWVYRGYKNTMSYYSVIYKDFEYPAWVYNEKFISSHRAALLFKDFDYYSQFGWEEKPELNYYWPSKIIVDNEIAKAYK